MKKQGKNILAIVISAKLFFEGFSHIFFPFYFANSLPPYYIFPLLFTFSLGLTEWCLGAGIIHKPTRQLCALGVLIVLFFVFPANIYVALNNGEPMGIAPTVAWGRLPLQALFFAGTWVLKKEEVLS